MHLALLLINLEPTHPHQAIHQVIAWIVIEKKEVTNKIEIKNNVLPGITMADRRNKFIFSGVIWSV